MIRSPRSTLLIYFILLFAVLGLFGWGHYFALNQLGVSPEDVLLGRAYSVNTAATFLILVAIYLLRKRMFSQIGFLFLAGSMLKFLLFFLLFNPTYREDGIVSRPEFIGFFIPYCLSLTIETLAVSKLLKGNSGSDS